VRFEQKCLSSLNEFSQPAWRVAFTTTFDGVVPLQLDSESHGALLVALHATLLPLDFIDRDFEAGLEPPTVEEKSSGL
jgi:hypothetical protein